MSYSLQERIKKELETSNGKEGGQIITSADGEITGNFSYIDSLTTDVAISAITLKNTWKGSSATRLVALSALPQRPIAVGFTAITLSAGTAVIYGEVDV